MSLQPHDNPQRDAGLQSVGLRGRRLDPERLRTDYRRHGDQHAALHTAGLSLINRNGMILPGITAGDSAYGSVVI